MRVHPSIIMVPILATLLFATGVQALEPSTDEKTTARSSRADLAQLLPAPTGHRQPTLNDLPPSLREEEEENPSAEAGSRIEDGPIGFLKEKTVMERVFIGATRAEATRMADDWWASLTDRRRAEDDRRLRSFSEKDLKRLG